MTPAPPAANAFAAFCRPFDTVLIANRGEIAVRIIAACRERGLHAVAVYSEADRRALHVAHADEAFPIGPAPAADSYLNSAAILAAARRSGAGAIHPGYGFLAENARFAQAVIDAGLVWIGPPPAAVEALGDKVAAKRIMGEAGVPLVPGYLGDGSEDEAELARRAAEIGFPVLIKAAAGGGGRGMRVVERAGDFPEALAGARREADAAFGDPRVYLEQLARAPRHIEVQVCADVHGNVIHLGERECSIQRRYQKVVEESPSPAVTPALREALGQAAVAAARAVGYVGVGTVEFLLDARGNFSFLEMNTRLQVEHPVTEAVAGLDLVQLQLMVAAGEPLPLEQADVALRGHAIECRIYAEDARHGFLPSSGPIRLFAPPAGPGVRNDVGVYTGDEVGVHYDPQLAKLIVHAPDRPAAIARLTRALRDYVILGPVTNLPFLVWLAEHAKFRAGNTTTDFIPRYWSPPNEAPPLPREILLGAAALDILDWTERVAAAASGGVPINPWQTLGAWRLGGGETALRLHYGNQDYPVAMNRATDSAWDVDLGAERTTMTVERLGPYKLLIREGDRVLLLHGITDPEGYLLSWEGQAYHLRKPLPPSVEIAGAHASSAGGHEALTAPMPGKVLKLNVAEGARVRANQPLLVLEAMKMEHIIAAPRDAVISSVRYKEGEIVAGGAVLVELEDAGTG